MFRKLIEMTMALLVLGAANLNAGRILLVGTSVATIPGTETATGVWGEELVLPYEAFVADGHSVDLASPEGRLPIDTASYDPEVVGRELARKVLGFLHMHGELLEDTLLLSEVDADAYDAVFVAGGHGVMWDLATDPDLRALTVEILSSGRFLATVCHGPAFLATARLDDGRFVIDGYRVTGFSDEEERAIEMDGVVPFSLEQGLREASGERYSSGPAFESHVVTDRNLVTGQNPASSAAAAEALLHLLEGEHGEELEVAAHLHTHESHQADTVVCDHCGGSGWVRGGPGYYRYRCPTCNGTGRRKRRPVDRPPRKPY